MPGPGLRSCAWLQNDGVSSDAYPKENVITHNHFHEIGVTGKQTAALFSVTHSAACQTSTLPRSSAAGCCTSAESKLGRRSLVLIADNTAASTSPVMCFSE